MSFDDRLKNRLDPMMLNVADLGFKPGSTRLYLFTPRHLPMQVLRPHQYNFTPGFIDKMAETYNGRRFLPNNFVDANSGPIISPDGLGMQMDTRTINELWSFVLICDTSPGGRFNNMGTVAGVRQIMIGYVMATDEPYNMATGTVNPNAVLNFTHSTMVRILPSSINANGVDTGFFVANDTDYVNELVQMQMPMQTYLATPSDMLYPTISSNDPIAAGNMCISNFKTSVASVPPPAQPFVGNEKPDVFSPGGSTVSAGVDAMLKSPVHHMSLLCDSLDKSISKVENSQVVKSAINLEPSWDDADVAKQYFKANAPGVSSNFPWQGLSPLTPMTIQCLDAQCGGGLTVIPYAVPAASQWDVYPQDQISHKNVMSSFVSMTLSALTPACGLAHIVFRYASWVKNRLQVGSDQGWQILDCSTIVGVPDPRNQLQVLDNFKAHVEAQLFPILKQVQGDFDLMAYVNISGEILVDLNFLDMNPSFSNVGFSETNARLGGMLNPLVVNDNILTNNTHAINALADSVICKGVGSNYGNVFAPTVDFANRTSMF